MLSRTIFFIGLHLCLIKIARPMVLFTANVEDIKKLARRFVSDNLAEQLAEFILKASNGINSAKISEENNQNAEIIEDVSDNKIGRTGTDTETTKPRKFRIKNKHSNKSSIYRREPEVTPKDGVVINVNWDEQRHSSTKSPFESYTKLTRNEADEKEIKDKEINIINDDTDRFGHKNHRYVDDKPKYNDGDETDMIATSGSIGLPKHRNTFW